jgi:hypothetical protein
MSTVVAMCGNNYALMSADSRLVKYSGGKIVKIVSENTKKVFRLNDSTLLGIAGDYLGYEHIVNAIVRRDNSRLYIPAIAQDVFNCAIGCKLGGLPLNILIAGKGENGAFIIAEMTSRNDYKPDVFMVDNVQHHQIRIAMPNISDPMALQQIKERVERLNAATTLEEMQARVENLIKNIANKNETVNKKVLCEIVT